MNASGAGGSTRTWGDRVGVWLLGARPRTLPASVVPVAVGTGASATLGGVSWVRAGLALVVSLALQVAVNYANDYSDGVRGTDATRVGPTRLVAGALATPAAVRRAALLAAAVAGVAGVLLAAATSWWLVPIGLVCVAAAWGYTGGPAPYGYLGLGDLAVFVFFGLVAVAGTAYVAAVPPRLGGLGWYVAVPCGLLAVALLAVNNLRDAAGDAVSGKRTLAVRLGDTRSRWYYAGCAGAPFLLAAGLAVTRPAVALTLLALPLAVGPIRRVLGGATGPELLPVLAATGRLQLAYGLLLAIGLSR